MVEIIVASVALLGTLGGLALLTDWVEWVMRKPISCKMADHDYRVYETIFSERRLSCLRCRYDGSKEQTERAALQEALDKQWQGFKGVVLVMIAGVAWVIWAVWMR